MDTNPKSASGEPETPDGVLCAKCDHVNPAQATVCERCGAHLYVTCPKCGRTNRRVSSRCTECGARLHRSLTRRWKKRFSSFKITPLQIGLILIVAFVVYKIIVMLAEYSPPPPE